MIASSAIIYPGVELGEDVIIEDFCIIGVPVKGECTLKTLIGAHSLIRSHTVIYAGNYIGSHFMTGNKVNIRELNQIGNNVSIGTLSVIEHHVTIEDEVRIHSQAFIPEYTNLKRKAWIGPNVTLTNAKYPLHAHAKETLQGCIVDENAKIGANSTLLPGIIIGQNSLVGAGSVVTKNVAPDTIVAGNPAANLRSVHYL